jgi:hypothetical protein
MKAGTSRRMRARYEVIMNTTIACLLSFVMSWMGAGRWALLPPVLLTSWYVTRLLLLLLYLLLLHVALKGYVDEQEGSPRVRGRVGR